MKTDNNKKINQPIFVFVALFVVICCNVLYNRSFIDLGYLLVVVIYFSKYLNLKKKSMS